MTKIQNLLIGFLILLLCSCISKPNKLETWLSKGVKVNLPAPHLTQTYHDQQLLTFNYNGQQHSLIAMIDADNHSLNVIGLSTLGIRLFKIDYRDNEIKTEQNIFIKELPPASQILSDIMLSIYPVEQWQAVLPIGWKLIDDKQHRILVDDKNQTIIEISYLPLTSSLIRKPNHIHHHVFGYQIAIGSME